MGKNKKIPVDAGIDYFCFLERSFFMNFFIMKNSFFTGTLFPQYNDTELSGYRRIITAKECEEELKEDLPILFEALIEGTERGSDECSKPSLKCRPFDANTINTWVLSEINEAFPGAAIIGAGGRVYFEIKGFLIIVKKLNDKGMPMNIPTDLHDAVLHQKKSCVLDDSIEGQSKPILVLGYNTDKFGNITGHMLTYIIGCPRWTISAESILSKEIVSNHVPEMEMGSLVRVKTTTVTTKKVGS